MVAVSTPVSLLVSDANSCAGKLVAPETTSVAMWIDNRIVWSDGSSLRPICLPDIQTITDLSDMAYMLGVNTDGCLVKIAITSNNITTCEGPVLTVPVTAVT